LLKSILCDFQLLPKYRESQNDVTAQPLFQSKLHGNEPNKGAQIDKEIADEEAEMIAKKDAKKK
jgi:hypothetical protein